MRYLPIILCFLLASCYTAKKANKHLAQAQAQYPDVVRAACVNYYPSKDSLRENITYIQGKTDTFTQMVEINCGEVVFFDTIINNVEVVKEKIVPKIVKVPCPATTKRVDTVYKDKFWSYENTAVIGQLNDRFDSLSEVVIVTKERLKTAKKRINIMTIGLIIIIATLALAIAAKKYFKI